MSFISGPLKLVWLFLAVFSLSFFVPSTLPAKEYGPWNLQNGNRIYLAPGWFEADKIKVAFNVTPFSTTGAQGARWEYDLEPGFKIVLTNTTKDNKDKTAELKVERGDDGSLKLSIINEGGFGWRWGDECGDELFGGGMWPDGCHQTGIDVRIYDNDGDPKIHTEKINRPVTLNTPENGAPPMVVDGKNSKIHWRLGAQTKEKKIDIGDTYYFNLVPGYKLEIRIRSLPSHKAMAKDDLFLYHLAEKDKSFALGQGGRIGFVHYKEAFGVGDGWVERKLKPGDVVTLINNNNNKGWAFLARHNKEQGYLIIRPDEFGDLGKIKINNEEPKNLEDGANVRFRSKGGLAGIRDVSQNQDHWQKQIATGNTQFLHSGPKLRVEFFTTLAAGGAKIGTGEDGDDGGGPNWDPPDNVGNVPDPPRNRML